MAACIEIEAGLREPPWPDVLNDYGLNGLPGEARHPLGFLACGRHVGRRCGTLHPQDRR